MQNLLLSEEDKKCLDLKKIYYDASNGYYRIRFKNCKYQYLHRYLMGAKKEDIIDHIDRNKHNNQRSNLRFATAKLNGYNKHVENKLGRGIYFDKFGNRYRACISHNNITLKLGSFKTINEAKIKYNEKALEIYGSDSFQHIVL
jgi:alpha-L-fucosidase